MRTWQVKGDTISIIKTSISFEVVRSLRGSFHQLWSRRIMLSRSRPSSACKDIEKIDVKWIFYFKRNLMIFDALGWMFVCSSLFSGAKQMLPTCCLVGCECTLCFDKCFHGLYYYFIAAGQIPLRKRPDDWCGRFQRENRVESLLDYFFYNDLVFAQYIKV